MKIKKKATNKPIKKKTAENEALTTQWTIRGISLEARNAAQKAADKSNEFIGSWVSRKLLEAAQTDLKGRKEVARQEDLYDIITQMQCNLKGLTEKINDMNQKPSIYQKLQRFMGVSTGDDEKDKKEAY